MCCAGTRLLTPEQRGSRFASLALPLDQAAGSYHVHPALGDSTIHAAAIGLLDPDQGVTPTRVPVSLDAFAIARACGGGSMVGGGGNAVSRTAALRGDGSGLSDMRWIDDRGCGSAGFTGLESKAMPRLLYSGEFHGSAVNPDACWSTLISLPLYR